MLAYHNDPALKAKIIAQLEAHAAAEAARAEQMRDEQLHNCLHGENALAAAFDLPDDVTNLHRWIIETFAPAGWEKRLGPFFTQWLLRDRTTAGEDTIL